MQINFITEHFSYFISGALYTAILVLSSLFLGFLSANIMVAGVWMRVRFFEPIINSYIFIVRGTPLLVQLFAMYYGIPQIPWIRQSMLWFIFDSPIRCAILVLSMNTAAYTYVIFSSSLKLIPEEEITASLALGLSRWQAFRAIFYKRMLRDSVPPYLNEVILVIKGSSVACAISVMEFTGVMRKITSSTYDPMMPFLISFIFYYLFGLGVVQVLKILINKPYEFRRRGQIIHA